jgi:hypothetical protein
MAGAASSQKRAARSLHSRDYDVRPDLRGRSGGHLEEVSAVRDAVNPLNSDHITVDHVRNPVAVNSQPVVSAPVESLGGERVFG